MPDPPLLPPEAHEAAMGHLADLYRRSKDDDAELRAALDLLVRSGVPVAQLALRLGLSRQAVHGKLARHRRALARSAVNTS